MVCVITLAFLLCFPLVVLSAPYPRSTEQQIEDLLLHCRPPKSLRKAHIELSIMARENGENALVATYICNEGFTFVGRNQTRICLVDGKWTGKLANMRCVKEKAGGSDEDSSPPTQLPTISEVPTTTLPASSPTTVPTTTSEEASTTVPATTATQPPVTTEEVSVTTQPPTSEETSATTQPPVTTEDIVITTQVPATTEITPEPTSKPTYGIYVPKCGEIDPQENGRLGHYAILNGVNEIAVMNCDPGYVMKGSSSVRCLKNDLWELYRPRCKQVDCGIPENHAIENGFMKWADTYYGSKINYFCDECYELVGFRKSMTCGSNGRWSFSDAHCVKKSNCEVVQGAK